MNSCQRHKLEYGSEFCPKCETELDNMGNSPYGYGVRE